MRIASARVYIRRATISFRWVVGTGPSSSPKVRQCLAQLKEARRNSPVAARKFKRDFCVDFSGGAEPSFVVPGWFLRLHRSEDQMPPQLVPRRSSLRAG